MLAQPHFCPTHTFKPQVHTLADRMGREAKAARMLQRVHALQLRQRSLEEQRVDAQQEMLAARADPNVGEHEVEAARLEVMVRVRGGADIFLL